MSESSRVRLLQNLVSARPWPSAASPQAPSALRMQRRRTKPLRGGPTAPSPMEIEWLDPRPLDAPGGVFGVTEGSSHGRDRRGNAVSRGRVPRIPAHRSARAWRAGILALLDRRAAEHRRFPSPWRSARRSDRPNAPNRVPDDFGVINRSKLGSIRLPCRRTDASIGESGWIGPGHFGARAISRRPRSVRSPSMSRAYRRNCRSTSAGATPSYRGQRPSRDRLLPAARTAARPASSS